MVMIVADQLMIANEPVPTRPQARYQTLDRAVDAFERELRVGGIHLDTLTRLDLLELVEKIEVLASGGPGHGPGRHDLG